MRYINLGKSDLRVSAVGQGTGQFGTSAWGYGTAFSRQDIYDTIRKDMELGVNTFDTAETYGDGKAEKLVGEALGGYRRDEFVVISKVAPWNLRYENVQKAAERSLARLNLRYIDLYLIHYPNPLVPMKETVAALERLVRDGKVRYIGTSNFHPILLQRANGLVKHEEIVANEIEYNVISRFSERYTMPYCVDNRIGVIAFSPLAGGILTGVYTRARPPRDRARAFNFTANLGFLQKLTSLQTVLEEIAGQKGCTVPQLALAWILMHKPCVPIPASLHPVEAVANAGAADILLSRAELEAIDRVTPSVGLLRYALDHFAIRPVSWAKEASRHLRMR